MADRIDTSQYGFTAGPPDAVAFLPDSGITDTQHQGTPDGVYAPAADLAGYPDHANPQDLLSVRPGDFYTQAPEPKKLYVAYRAVSPAGGFLIPARGTLAGFSFRETTTTAPAVIRIRDGADSSAPPLCFISLAAAESVRDWFAPTGIRFVTGLYLEVVSGAIEGAVYLLEETHV